MYRQVKSKVRIGDTDVFVRVGVHQGSVLSPLLFIIMLEAISKEFCTGLPLEMLYANDLIDNQSGEMEESPQGQRTQSEHGKDESPVQQQRPRCTFKLRKVALRGM